MKTPTKVWPLTHSIPGYNALGDPITLQPGMPGWMDMPDALAAEAAGTVDVMAGKTPQTLRKPCYETRVAAATEAPLEVPEEPEAAEEKPKATTSRRGPAKRRQYRRTDMKAEN